MARKPKAPEQDSTPIVPDADILPEGQQLEQTENPPPEMTAEEAEAAAAEMPAPEEDTRQEWEKPLAEIEAEQ